MLRTTLFIIAAIGLAACGGDGGTEPEDLDRTNDRSPGAAGDSATTPFVDARGPMKVLFKGATIPFNDTLPTTLRFEDSDGPLEIDIVAFGGNLQLRGTIDVFTQVAVP